MAGEHTLAELKLKVTQWCTPAPPNQCHYQVLYGSWTHFGRAKRSHHDAHIHLRTPPTNVPPKCQPSTPYGIQEIAQTRFYRSRSLRQGQRSNQGHTMTLHNYNPPPVYLSSINFLHLNVSEISLGQGFIGQGHYGKAKGQIKVAPWRCTPTPPNQCPTKYQLLTPYGFRDIARTRFHRSRSLWQG